MAVGLFCAFGGYRCPAVEGSCRNDPEGAAADGYTAAVVILPTPTPGAGMPAGVTPAASATAASNLPALPWGEFGYGIAANAVIAADGDYSITSAQIKEHLGLGWLKQQVRWDEVYEDGPEEADWGLYDPVVESANEAGLKVMLSVVDAPLWTRSYIDSDPLGAPPDDLTVYANFLGELVDRYKGKFMLLRSGMSRTSTASGIPPRASTRNAMWRCCASLTRPSRVVTRTSSSSAVRFPRPVSMRPIRPILTASW